MQSLFVCSYNSDIRNYVLQAEEKKMKSCDIFVLHLQVYIKNLKSTS